MGSLLITGARVIDPERGMDAVADVGVRNGRFVNAEELESPESPERLDLTGKVLCPGFMDMHVHLRDPGQTAKESLTSGTAAAAAGGFTSVLAMPNTIPAMDIPETLRALLARTPGCPVRVLQCAAITLERAGVELTDMSALRAAGAAAFSDDGNTTQFAGIMKRAMLWARTLGVTLIDHCEDTSLSKPGVMHEGRLSRELGLPGQPRSAEENIVARDIILARETGARIHLQHLSSAGSVAMLRHARAEGVPVTGEVTPHHLFLTDEACRRYATNAKMAPPLREESDRQALVEALADGTLSAIATDHAPHTADEKARGWLKAPFGIVGIEAAVPLCLTELYHTGIVSLQRLVSLFTNGPRAVLGLPPVSLAAGETADATVLSLDDAHVIRVADFKSCGRNCPYDGWKCIGSVYGTLLGGVFHKA